MKKLKKVPPIHDTLTGYEFCHADKPLTPRQAMRQKCIECCAGSRHEVRKCSISDCTLWPFRHGKGSDTGDGPVIRKTTISAEEIERRTQRLAEGRVVRKALDHEHT